MRHATTIDAVRPDRKLKTEVRGSMAASAPEVLAVRADGNCPLDDLVRRGARQMLQADLESDVQAFHDQHASTVDEQGRRLVVRNGSLPARQILSAAGPLQMTQSRVQDKSAEPSERVRFSSSILSPYLRQSKRVASCPF
jgi:hypothetical protein